MQDYIPDIVVKDSNGQYLAFIEIKNGQKITFESEPLTEYFRDLLTYYNFPRVPYFLIVSQEKGYLWEGSKLPVTSPDVEFSIANVVKRYASEQNSWLRGYQLESVVLDWLHDLARLENKSKKEPERLPELAEFVNTLQGSYAQREAKLAV
jgi:hypothetical protein